MNYTLTIAGFDPSSGAGLTSDLKTFESHGVYGLAVCTAITIQNDVEFRDIKWVDQNLIIDQIEVLFDRFEIEVVKIGIVESLESLDGITETLLSLNPDIKIVWDPILKSSSGFSFHNELDQKLLSRIAKKCYLTTPNLKEWNSAFADGIDEDQIWKKFGNILLKSAEENDGKIEDHLITETGISVLEGERKTGSKHGSGCVLSSAIAANLTKGEELQTACVLAKKYIENYLISTETLLGVHHD